MVKCRRPAPSAGKPGAIATFKTPGTAAILSSSCWYTERICAEVEVRSCWMGTLKVRTWSLRITQIDLREVPETAEDESRARDQNQGERELRNHQHPPQTIVAGARRTRPAAFL